MSLDDDNVLLEEDDDGDGGCCCVPSESGSIILLLLLLLVMYAAMMGYELMGRSRAHRGTFQLKSIETREIESEATAAATFDILSENINPSPLVI